MAHSKVLQQNRGSDPEDEGGAGVLQQGHHGEGLQELEGSRIKAVGNDDGSFNK